MRLGFVSSLKTVSGDATAAHQLFPRKTRIALRVPKSKAHAACANTHQGVDDYMQTELRADTYHNQNLVDADPMHDEFGDIDNEFDGLTITEPMDEVELFRFCTGYDIL